MTRVFISGPISGKPNLNRDAFDHEERLLREAGYETFNPHSIAKPNLIAEEEWYHLYMQTGVPVETSRWRYYMGVCVGQIPLCDSMRMLPDWQNSRGAVWEHRIAKMLGLEITYCHVPDIQPKW